MATTSLLGLDIQRLLRTAERLTGTKLPRDVVEVTLETELNKLCIRFRKPFNGELGEPAHPHVHLFRDRVTRRVSAVELLEINRFPG